MHLRDIVKVKTNTHTKYSTNPMSIMLKIYFKQRKLPDGTVHNLSEPERYFTAMRHQPDQVSFQECKIMFNPNHFLNMIMIKITSKTTETTHQYEKNIVSLTSRI